MYVYICIGVGEQEWEIEASIGVNRGQIVDKKIILIFFSEAKLEYIIYSPSGS